MATILLENINEASLVLKDDGAFFAMKELSNLAREKLLLEGYEEVSNVEQIKRKNQFSIEASEIGFYFFGYDGENN
ncbi:hypothetical protein [Paenibacillus polymyxa]|uniref:Uncharacterized protein n=1 Tax=Paenibacillus polymyxa (strain SC2) TaxID=886882 RepID=E3EJT7_PAEPS|nr:hypothetical protein [Paenibacillus polymyxa]ADO59685.1 hypothetical protein PPSC2_26695 [Paenibacillus polymyxa SC2]WPQ59490.1 hypothetical protein SKN87_27900 [Paenibacillus polymyxa]